ncbi:MAG TPA: hypothetical protein PKA95_12410, partial [Thermomicrobiales bacterium]|nr:hypothetical protein [Thermomicrobiales bacterium]
MSDAREDEPDLGTLSERMRHWRAAHPRAMLTEIEREVDRQVDAARAKLVAEMAGMGPADGVCPDCGTVLAQRGTRERRLLTDGGEALTLSRAYARCPA